MVFEKFTSAYLFQIAHEKLCDYLLTIYMKKFRDGITLLPKTTIHTLCHPVLLDVMVGVVTA